MSFEVHDVAKQLIEALREPLTQIARHDAELAKQLRRAGPSVLLNIGEGARRSGKDRLHHYRIAAGSAGEVRDVLFTARAWRYIEPMSLDGAERLLDRVLAMLWRLTHPRA
jgi:four helix bundle protein